MPTRMLILSDEQQDEYEQWQKDVLAEVEAEYKAYDPVQRDVRYHYFVSKSQGWRKNKSGTRTKRRLRRNWEEVQLVSYRGGRFMTWRKFPFDEYATECLKEEVSSEDATETFRERIEKMDRDRRKEWRR